MLVVTTVVVVIIIAGGGGIGRGVVGVGVITKLHECKWMHYIHFYVPVIMTMAQMPFN